MFIQVFIVILVYPSSITVSGWWFETFFIFPYIGNSHPKWQIFFRQVYISGIQLFFANMYTHYTGPWCYRKKWFAREMDAPPAARLVWGERCKWFLMMLRTYLRPIALLCPRNSRDRPPQRWQSGSCRTSWDGIKTELTPSMRRSFASLGDRPSQQEI